MNLQDELDKLGWVADIGTPVHFAQKMKIDSQEQKIVHWMFIELESYRDNFDHIFSQKLERCTTHQFENEDDFRHSFVGPDRRKVYKEMPRNILFSGTCKHILYVDTWAVPIFNTTQTREDALNGVLKTIRVFETLLIPGAPITVYQFSRLCALYARPEFDDIARYKIQHFPTDVEQAEFGKERSDAKTLGDHYPLEKAVVTNEELSLSDLYKTFGCKVHYLGLIPHNSEIRADGRLFTGPRDFYEHDNSHAYFTITQPPPGRPCDWEAIHLEFEKLTSNESIVSKEGRLTIELVYFEFTHESGYTSVIPDEDGKLKDPDAYNKIKNRILERMHIENDYDFLREESQLGEKYENLITEYFPVVKEFFELWVRSVMTVPN